MPRSLEELRRREPQRQTDIEKERERYPLGRPKEGKFPSRPPGQPAGKEELDYLHQLQDLMNTMQGGGSRPFRRPPYTPPRGELETPDKAAELELPPPDELMAGGGPVGGWGGPKSDSVPIMASKGEFVVTADGSNLGDAIEHFKGKGMAGGGQIAPIPVAYGQGAGSDEEKKKQREQRAKKQQEEARRQQEEQQAAQPRGRQRTGLDTAVRGAKAEWHQALKPDMAFVTGGFAGGGEIQPDRPESEDTEGTLKKPQPARPDFSSIGAEVSAKSEQMAAEAHATAMEHAEQFKARSVGTLEQSRAREEAQAKTQAATLQAQAESEAQVGEVKQVPAISPEPPVRPTPPPPPAPAPPPSIEALPPQLPAQAIPVSVPPKPAYRAPTEDELNRLFNELDIKPIASEEPGRSGLDLERGPKGRMTPSPLPPWQSGESMPLPPAGDDIHGDYSYKDQPFATGGIVSALIRGFANGGLVRGFTDTVASLPGYAQGGAVATKSTGSNTLSSHSLDLRTNAGTFSASVSEDTMGAIRNSSLNGKLSSTGPRPTWYS